MITTATVCTGTTTAAPWNGPVCQVCGKGYLNTHTCDPVDLLAKAAALIERARLLQQPAAVDRTQGCPCRENGGSGVCGCIFGGPQIMC